MNTVLGLIVVGLLAFFGSALFKISRLTPMIRALVASGAAFFFVGVLLGPRMIGLLNDEIVNELDVVANLGVGWVGLLFGLQFRYADFRKIPLPSYFGAMTEALVSMGVIFAVLWSATLLRVLELGVFVLAVLAAIGSTTSSNTGLSSMQSRNPRGPITDAIRLFESLDAIPAVLVVGIGLCISLHPTESDGILSGGMACAAVVLLLGVVMGVLFHLLILYSYGPNQLMVIVLGFCVFCAGASHYLHMSSLFVNFIVGLVVANTSKKRRLLFRSLVKLEKPFYLVLLTLAGCMWSLPPISAFVIILMFLSARVGGKLLGGMIAAKVSKLPTKGRFGVGTGLFAHDGMALALALNVRQYYPDMLGDTVLTATIATILFGILIGPWYLQRLLLAEKEIV